MPRPEQDTPSAQARAIRAVAWLEALKGAVVLLAATGLLSLVHGNLEAVVPAFIEHLHLDPASRYPDIFLDLASSASDTHLQLLAAGAVAYSSVRFVEAYGLFRERAWAEVLAALSGSIYVPFEVLELARRPTWHGATLLGINLTVVGVMVLVLVNRRKAAARQTA